MYGKDMFVSALLSAIYLAPTQAAPTSIGSWYQENDSPVAELFAKRYTSSPSDANFTSNYPAGWQTPPTSSLPKAWIDKLASISMPKVSVSAQNNGYPTYPAGEKGGDQTICSFTYQCSAEDDLVNPPDGVLSLAFDDGPTSESPRLYDFLQSNNISDKATHFMIGGSILGNPSGLQEAASHGGHIAVHTWSHPYMTSMTNEQVLGELGWTMQIISDLNGGRLPRYWRPPFGDVDNRVRTIAKEVFGLETVPWNKDSADWAIGNNPQYTLDSQERQMSDWLSASKSPGLNILEHELNDRTVSVFIASYPHMVENKWDVRAVPDAWGMPWYQNTGDSNTQSVTSMNVGMGTLAVVGSSTAMSSMPANGSTTMSASSSMNMTSTTSTVSTSSSSSAAASGSISAVAVAAGSASSTGGAGRELSNGGVSAIFVVMLGFAGGLLL